MSGNKTNHLTFFPPPKGKGVVFKPDPLGRDKWIPLHDAAVQDKVDDWGHNATKTPNKS
jgi:hypothetical protein